MRSLVTWALVTALTLIALAAAVDAVRAGSAASKAAPIRTVVTPTRQACPKAVEAVFRGEGGLIPCPRRPRAHPPT